MIKTETISDYEQQRRSFRMMSQKEGVFSAIVELFNFTGGKFDATKEQRKEIIEVVTDGIVNGNIEFSAEAKAKYKTRDEVKGYTNGMVSNWLRKDTRLNGGEKYVTKNPGSRAGQGDTTLTELKKLKSTLTDASHLQAVDDAIELRKNELAAEKSKNVTVDLSKIPDHLKAALGLS
jgi:hypothetical protein